MSRFNRPSRSTRIVNRAGGEAFEQDERLKLVSMLLTSFVKDQYYRSAGDTLEELNKLILDMRDKAFAARAAVYARNRFGMRSITHAAAVGVVNSVKDEEWVKYFVDNVIRRPDDATEIVAYHLTSYGKPLPNNLKKGIAMALTGFDEYQMAKYRGSGKSVSLVDLVNLTHPDHTEAIGKLVNGTLSPANTWETKMTQAGQQASSEEEKEEAKREAWANLVSTRKIGYFALLRNLRNILQDAPHVIPDALEMLADEKLIRKSLVLPFRYLTAMEALRSISGSREVIAALGKALDIAVANVPTLDGKTAVIIDGSGSMGRFFPGTALQTASIFGAVLYKSNDADIVMFSNEAGYLTLNPNDTTMTLAEQIGNAAPRGGTNFHAALNRLNRAYDRLVFLTDMQGWVRYNAPTKTLAQYEKRYSVHPHVYNIDLAGYGDMQFPQDRLYCLAGFSEKVFDVMELLETDRQALISEIERVKFRRRY